MAQSEGFYMTLPSDGSHESFPDNRLSYYKTLLPYSLELTDGEWEVALTEMMYDHSVRNISPDEAYLDVMFEGTLYGYVKDPDPFKSGRFTLEKVDNIQLGHAFPLVKWQDSYYDGNYRKEILTSKRLPDDKKDMKVMRLKFRAGAYSTAKALIKEMNLGLRLAFNKMWDEISGILEGQVTTEEKEPEENEKSSIQLAYDQIYDRIIYQVNGKKFRERNTMCVRFPLSLAYKLGFGQKALFVRENPEVEKFLALDEFYGHRVEQRDEHFGIGHTKWLNITYLAPNSIDLFENLKRMYVYCDIVESQIVGSNAIKLLRVIPVGNSYDADTNEDKQAKWEPIRAEYLKLSKKHFDTIEIQIRNNLGQLYPFLRGKTVAKLHFRKAY